MIWEEKYRRSSQTHKNGNINIWKIDDDDSFDTFVVAVDVGDSIVAVVLDRVRCTAVFVVCRWSTGIGHPGKIDLIRKLMPPRTYSIVRKCIPARYTVIHGLSAYARARRPVLPPHTLRAPHTRDALQNPNKWFNGMSPSPSLSIFLSLSVYFEHS